MTRKEQIIEVGIEYTMQNSPFCIGGDNFYELARELNRNKSFEAGAKWADEHPKSPWINVNDDLPCNHEELLLSTKYHTVSVFTYKKGGAVGIDNMIIRNGKWEWEAWKENYLYWMPIPNLPKE